MPPRGHSSSSHSSHSSRSSGSFSRSRSSSSFGSSSFSRSPSPHSTSSYSSRPNYYSRSSRPARQPAQPPRRPRVNQPLGYLISSALRPTYHYAVRHDYVYYPESWTDSSSGMTYEKGYYDENGKRYDNVAFKKDGQYDNVVCHCPYCEQDTIISLKSATPARQELTCPHCGGMMEIRSALDEYSGVSGTSTEASEIPVKPKKKKSSLKWILIVALILLALRVYGNYLDNQTTNAPYGTGIESVQLSKATVYLKKTGAHTYVETGSSSGADKKLTYDRDSDSYYDADTDCWLWYNTDVTPSVWQYWYEGISSDYGDYGWMEHSGDGWYIEKSADQWVKLPTKYDTGRLWYIE